MHKNKMIASDTIPASENNVETIDTPKETVKDNYEDLQRKIERLIVNVEEQRKRNEEENKAKFLQLLEVVNNHLNETLVRGIENTIKKEVKLGIGQIKKNLDENIKEIEEKTNKLGNKIEMISKAPRTEEQLPSSDQYLEIFREVFFEEILPIVESCFEEVKLQTLTNFNMHETVNADDTIKSTISVKDEIANLLESSHANEAVMFAFDCEDPELLLFLIENLSNANIEKLNPHLQYLMIQKAYCLYKEVQNENILICLCNLIMNIDINELKKDMIMDLLAIFDEVVKIEWSEQIHMNLIVKMQRKHAMKKINKTA